MGDVYAFRWDFVSSVTLEKMLFTMNVQFRTAHMTLQHSEEPIVSNCGGVSAADSVVETRTSKLYQYCDIDLRYICIAES